MNKAPDRFEKQAEGQRKRTRLSWPEKIRMAETMRATVVNFAAMRRGLDEERARNELGTRPNFPRLF